MWPAEVRSFPALTAWFGWNVNLNAPFTSDRSFVPEASNKIAKINIETKMIIILQNSENQT